MSEIKTVRTSGVIPHTPIIEPLSINQNGTYTAPSGVDGYSPITVDVQEEPWAPLKDGYSNFWFELDENTLSPWLNFSAKTNDAVIDWGDGSGEVALDTLTPTHTYSKAGKYVVKVKGVTGIASIFGGIVPAGKYINTLINIELNADVVTLGTSAFARCASLEHFTMTSSVTQIASNTLNLCSNLRSIVIPDSVTDIAGAAFAYCTSLRDVTLSSNVKTIGYSSFSTCPILAEITIPSTVTDIGNSTFAYGSSLSTIHMLPTTPPTLGTNVFLSLPLNYVIYVPVGYGDTYKAASGWSTYADHIVEEGSQLTRAQLRKISEAEDNTKIEEEEMR